MLAVENLEVVYNDVVLVLRGISLQVPDGKIVALLGTLLYVAAATAGVALDPRGRNGRPGRLLRGHRVASQQHDTGCERGSNRSERHRASPQVLRGCRDQADTATPQWL